MEKLVEKINTFNVCSFVKGEIIKVAEIEEINIQQACRKLIKLGIVKYQEEMQKKNELRVHS